MAINNFHLKRLYTWLRSPVGQIFLAALLLRIFLAPFFFHPDLKTIFYNSHFLTNGILNIYDYLLTNPDKSYLGPFVYPPLTYFFWGIIFPLVKMLAGFNFVYWLSLGNDAVAEPSIFRYLFFMKVPLFIFEFLTGLMIIKILKNDREKKIALLFWFFNPVNIYVIVLMGQFDIIPTFFTLLAIYLTTKPKFLYLASFALGLGAAFKTYSLIFLPFLSVILGKNWKEKLKLFIVGLIPYVLFTIPFLRSISFRESTLLSDLSQRIFFLGFNLGFEEQILLVPLFLILLFFFASSKEKREKQDLLGYFLVIPLVILAGIHFHPQWLIWTMPFLSIFIARQSRLVVPIVCLILGWFGVTLLFGDKFLSFGLFSPLDPSVLLLPPPREIIKNLVEPDLLQSIFHTLFSASALWIVYFIIVRSKYEKV